MLMNFDEIFTEGLDV